MSRKMPKQEHAFEAVDCTATPVEESSFTTKERGPKKHLVLGASPELGT